MVELLEAVLVGILAGAVLTHLLLRRAALDEAGARFEAWRAQDVGRLRRQSVADGRLRVKSEVGSTLRPDLSGFPYAPSDVRFLGDPLAFVVFDGHSDVKDGSAGSLSAVVFVDVGDPRDVSKESALVAECVADGRVRWETLVLGQTGTDTSSSLPVSTS